MSWSGFSDEDLRRLKQNNSGYGDTERPADWKSNPSKKPGRKPPPKDRHLRQKPNNNQHSKTEISKEQCLAKVTVEKTRKKQLEGEQMQCGSASQMTKQDKQHVKQEDKDMKVDTSGVDGEQCTQKEPENQEVVGVELEEADVLTREMSNLERFQTQQKAMEELNRKKKEILTKAVAERKKKASAEANKLTHIQQELLHIDSLLNVDVSILRNKIEESSREFTEAQKRYDRAEKEFIESKMDLFKKSQKKELLTENLYSIIHENELRKSKKLGELTAELELEISQDTSTELPVPPPLSLFTTGPSMQGSPSPIKAMQSPTSLSNKVNSTPPVFTQPGATDHRATVIQSNVTTTASNQSVDSNKDCVTSENQSRNNQGESECGSHVDLVNKSKDDVVNGEPKVGLTEKTSAKVPTLAELANTYSDTKNDS